MIPSRASLQNCIVKIKDGLFSSSRYNKSQTYLFTNPVKSFEIYRPPTKPSFWAISGTHKTQFLKVISGQYIPHPPLSRTYPSFSENFQYDQIQFLNFAESSGLDKVHLSARYESFSYKGELEMTDDVNSVRNYITGANNYNTSHEIIDTEYVSKLLKLFDLEHLQNKWVNSLSNGQLRRARLAKSLINKPSLLVIDDPFLGLDPDATIRVSESIARVADEFSIAVVLGLRGQDNIPEWISDVATVTESGLEKISKRTDLKENSNVSKVELKEPRKSKPITIDSLKGELTSHIEFKNASVVYKEVPILTEFNWIVPRGSKWRILGNNGTGKTTLLSLITADHPQSWKSVLSINGQVRKTGSGASFFDINNKIGITSPELHALVPPRKTMMQVIMSGLCKDVGNSNFLYVAKEDKIDSFARSLLDIFDDRLSKYGDVAFNELSLTDQKLALFLRATIKNPEILILDEAFSCMDDIDVMHRCHDLVQSWSEMTVLAIAHIEWELPTCDYVLKLVGNGKPHSVEVYTE
ncbi:hypothetical protein CAAN1_10S01332 [[Candida] anglica]|uniref:ABC transporter domain-containing protein n=1 Tax=[Candida] anglica TaxID=148631 RepID=A0ABP0EH32_9ASCO